MASYALQTPLRVAHAKPPRPPKKLKVGNNNGHLRIANATLGGACKAAWANILLVLYSLTLHYSMCPQMGFMAY